MCQTQSPVLDLPAPPWLPFQTSTGRVLRSNWSSRSISEWFDLWLPFERQIFSIVRDFWLPPSLGLTPEQQYSLSPGHKSFSPLNNPRWLRLQAERVSVI